MIRCNKGSSLRVGDNVPEPPVKEKAGFVRAGNDDDRRVFQMQVIDESRGAFTVECIMGGWTNTAYCTSGHPGKGIPPLLLFLMVSFFFPS